MIKCVIIRLPPVAAGGVAKGATRGSSTGTSHHRADKGCCAISQSVAHDVDVPCVVNSHIEVHGRQGDVAPHTRGDAGVGAGGSVISMLIEESRRPRPEHSPEEQDVEQDGNHVRRGQHRDDSSILWLRVVQLVSGERSAKVRFERAHRKHLGLGWLVVTVGRVRRGRASMMPSIAVSIEVRCGLCGGEYRHAVHEVFCIGG